MVYCVTSASYVTENPANSASDLGFSCPVIGWCDGWSNALPVLLYMGKGTYCGWPQLWSRGVLWVLGPAFVIIVRVLTWRRWRMEGRGNEGANSALTLQGVDRSLGM